MGAFVLERNIMDTAFLLKQRYDKGKITCFKQAEGYLNDSELIKQLLSYFDFNILNMLNRIIELTEIPFAYNLERVQKWVHKLADLSFCNHGFSITGKSDDILSCYNSMIISALLKLHYTDFQKIDAGIDWIKKYQNFERGLQNNWEGTRILKYGGCMKEIPCYIGVVKATLALSDYKRVKGSLSKELEIKLAKGLEYILEHQLFKRRNSDIPITKDILKLTYPFSYKTNIIEILRLLKENNLINDQRCQAAKEYLQSKKHKDGYWKVNSSYFPKCWIPFDMPKNQGVWVTHEIVKIIV